MPCRFLAVEAIRRMSAFLRFGKIAAASKSPEGTDQIMVYIAAPLVMRKYAEAEM